MYTSHMRAHTSNMKPLKILCISTIAAVSLSITGSAYAGYYDQGLYFYRVKNYEKAREMLIKAGETSNDGHCYFFLGDIEMQENNFDKALEYFKLSVNRVISPKYLRLSYANIMIILEQRGDYMGVVKMSKEMSLKMGDGDARVRVEALINKFLWTDNQDAKAEYEKGIRFRNLGKTDDAESSFKAALKTDSAFLAPKFELGLLYLKAGNTTDAVRCLNDVADKIPFYGDVQVVLGDIQFQKESYRQALAHFSKALDYGFFDAGTLYLIYIKRASSFYNIREYKKAGESVAEALKLNPKSMEAFFLLSAIDIKEENYAEALKTLERAEALEPDNTEILFQLGSVHYKTASKKYIQYFDRLFDLNAARQKETPQKYHKAFALLAKAYHESSQDARALAIADKLPEKYLDTEMKFMLARTHAQLGNTDKAIGYFEKLSLSSDDDRYLLCALYGRAGQKDKSKRILLGLPKSYLERARGDAALSGIARDIDEERRIKEEEKLKKEEEARARREEELRIKREAEARQKAETEARLKKEEENKLKLEPKKQP